jgi:Ran GTPase-activating protein (RanGAP) involved in mRNA processing and transport
MLNEYEKERLRSLSDLLIKGNYLYDNHDVLWLIEKVLDLEMEIEDLQLKVDQLEGKA